MCTRIVNYEQKEMVPLTDKEKEYYEWQKNATYIKKGFTTATTTKKIYKLYRKVRDHCHFTGKFKGAAHGICNLRYRVPHEIPVNFIMAQAMIIIT